MRRMFTVIALISIMISCSPKTFVITPDYLGRKIKGKTLAIVPFIPEPVIENRIDIIANLGEGNPLDTYKEYFKTNLIHFFKKHSYFKKMYYTNMDSSSQLKKRSLVLNEKTKLSFLIPPDGAIIKTDSADADYVLFLQNIFVSRSPTLAYYNSIPYYHVAYYGGTPIQHGDFLFWDNRSGKIVSYGAFTVKGLSKMSIYLIGKFILSNSPFKIKRIYRGMMPR